MKRGIILYRSILRQHKKIPYELKVIGDKYVREEFQLHKNISDPEHLFQFYAGWEQYLDILKKKNKKVGIEMDQLVQAALNDDQKEKLKELRNELCETIPVDTRG